MRNLIIEKTKRTPKIEFYQHGELFITGNSISENAIEFYQPIMMWIEEFLNTNPEKIYITVDLEYINTSCTACLIKLLKQITTNYSKKANLKIIWKFDRDDDDNYEYGGII